MDKNVDILKEYYSLSAVPSRMRTREHRERLAGLEIRIRRMTAEEKRVARMAISVRK